MQNHKLINPLMAILAELDEIKHHFVMEQAERDALDQAVIQIADVALQLSDVKARTLADDARGLVSLAAKAYDAGDRYRLSPFVALDILHGAVMFTQLLIDHLTAASRQSDAKVATATYPHPKVG